MRLRTLIYREASDETEMKSATGIIRCIQPSRHTGRVYKGWQARIYTPSRERQRYFSDNQHGGAKKAKAAAETWRLLMLGKLPLSGLSSRASTK